jgi:outer membrane protein assembly factor BamB
MNVSMLLLIAFALAAILPAADWPAFRGPNGSGVAADDRAPADLTLEKGLAWKVALPGGLSSPIVVRSRVFLTGSEGVDRIVVALDAATGKEAWKRTFPRTREETAREPNSHSTPSMGSDGDNVYAYFHDFALMSFTFDGKERWRVPLGPFNSLYGLASSLTVAEGSVFLWTDLLEESVLRAYDASSGRVRWSAMQRPQTLGGYATPIVYRPPNGPAQLVVVGSGEAVGYQIATGERLWWTSCLTAFAAASPVLAGDMLYVSTAKEPPQSWDRVAKFDVNNDGRIPIDQIPQDNPLNVVWKRIFVSIDKRVGNGDGVLTREEWDKNEATIAASGGLTALSLAGKADLSENVRWRYTKAIPYYSSPLIYRGVLYTVKDGGIVSAFDPADGKVHKVGRLPDATAEFYASPVAGDGRLFFVNVDGKLIAARAGVDWEPLTSTELGEKVMASPALAGGRLFVRGDKHLFCFGQRD